MTSKVDGGNFVIEIEQEVIGSLLLGADFRRVVNILKPNHFLEPVHGVIFEALGSSYDRFNSTLPAVIIKTIPDDAKEAYKNATGKELITYLASLSKGAVFGSAALENTAKRVVDQWAKNELIKHADELISKANNPVTSPDEIVRETGLAFDDVMSNVRTGVKKKSQVSIFDAANNAFAAAEEARRNGTGLTGLSWGLTDVNRVTGGIHKRDLTLIGGRPSMGKAQPLSAMIKTLSGWKSMGNIKLGDQLASIDGSPSFVTGVFPKGKRTIYKITFSDGRSTKACAEHLWEVESSRFKDVKVWNTEEISKKISTERYRRRLYIPRVSGDFGFDKDIKIEPWLLGVFIGNGNMSNATPVISTGDAAVLFRLQKTLSGKQRISAANDYDYRIAGINGVNEFAESLISLGLGFKKSEEKFIPHQYLNASKDVRLDLMRGLMDTDGWVEKFGSVRYSTSSKQLARDVQMLARSLGALCTISSKETTYKYKGRKVDGLTHYVCNISHENAHEFMTLVRKSKRCKRTKPVRLTVMSVEKCGEEDVQCISVSHQRRLYITDDYIVTHNTLTGLSTCIKVADAGHGVGFISLEMDADKLAARAVTDIAFDQGLKVPYQELITGQVNENDIFKLRSANEKLHDMPLIIEEQSGLTLGDIRIKLEIMLQNFEKLGKPLELLMIDHLGLIKASNRYAGNRNNEIAEMTSGLKSMAREYDIAVVLLSQLNRGLEQQADKRPMLSSLRDSGAIEQDADTIILLYRESYYLGREKSDDPSRQAEISAKLLDCENKLEFAIAKQRNGPVTSVDLFVDVACSSVRNWGYY